LRPFPAGLLLGLALCLGGSCSLVEGFSPEQPSDSWADKLNLLPEQAGTIQELRTRFLLEMGLLRKQMSIKRLELRILSPEEFKGQQGDPLRREMQTLMLQIRERSLFYQQEALKVLSPEQQENLPPGTDLGFHGRFGMGPGPGMRKGMGHGRAPAKSPTELQTPQP
jgi:hypothetical protein